MTDTATIHPFEKAGLGAAPFTFTGVTKQTYQAHHSAPVQPGTSCDYCSTGIMFVCGVRGADGREFKVGCDCIQKIYAKGTKIRSWIDRKANEIKKRDAAERRV